MCNFSPPIKSFSICHADVRDWSAFHLDPMYTTYLFLICKHHKMERGLLLLFIFTTCSAALQDLSGKMFTFPAQSKTAHVKLTLPEKNFTVLSVCLRYFTDLTRAQSLFSMATTLSNNEFLLFKEKTSGHMAVYSRNRNADFYRLPDMLNIWMSVCATWESGSGLIQVWVNGRPSSHKKGHTGYLEKTPFVVIGQEQDSLGGGFDASQSFVGMLTDIHTWDYKISASEIGRFSTDTNFTPGNVLNWRALEYSMTGDVFLEDRSPTECF